MISSVLNYLSWGARPRPADPLQQSITYIEEQLAILDKKEAFLDEQITRESRRANALGTPDRTFVTP